MRTCTVSISILGYVKMSDHDILNRTINILLSGLLITTCSPLIILIGLLIKITSRGKILIKQRRVGLNKKTFEMYKFRSMYENVDHNLHREYFKDVVLKKRKNRGLYKLTDDPRVTTIGRILRKFSLDEIPQFFNVIMGDMNIIGPRPAIPYELEFYKDWHFFRFNVKPGITGYWQVSGRNKWDFDTMVRMDIHYINNRSFPFDLVIIIKTPLAMFFERASA